MNSNFLKTVFNFSLAFGIFFSGTFLMNQQAFANTQISIEKAKEIALKHAKITDKNIYFSDIELDNDFGRIEYDLEFFHNNIEYDYEIDAVTGEVKSFNQEKQMDAKPLNMDIAQYIGEAQAKEIALKHAKLSAKDVQHSKVKFEIDDNRAVYEIDFYANKKKYEYEIDAATSEIIEFGQE